FGSRADRRGLAGDSTARRRGHDDADRDPRDAVRRGRRRSHRLHGRRRHRRGGAATRDLPDAPARAPARVPARGPRKMTGFLEFWRVFIVRLPEFLPYLLRGVVVTVEITLATLAF